MNEAYEQWHRRMAQSEVSENETLYPWHRTVMKLLPDLNGKEVLELGCGRGDFSISLARRYPSGKFTGIDSSTAAIEVANSKLLERDARIEFKVDDAENLHLDTHSFDYIISCECLEHVLKPNRMAEEIARCLKPGGGFILTTENYFNGMLLAWLACWLRKKPFNSGSGAQPHENFFFYWDVHRLLKTAGLHVDHMESNHFQWLLLPGVAPARLCTKNFKSRFWKRLFRPFGRHFTYLGRKV